MEENKYKKNNAVISAQKRRWPLQGRRDEKQSFTHGNDQPAFSVPEVPRDAAGLDRRIELYELQLKNLRAELEQIKIQSILQGLNAREKEAEDEPFFQPEPYDATLFENIYSSHSELTLEEISITEWASIDPVLGYESPFPIPKNRSLVKHEPVESDKENTIIFSLSLQIFQMTERIKSLEKYIYYLSSRIETPEPVERIYPGNSVSYDQLAEMCVESQDKISELEKKLSEFNGLENRCLQLKASRDELHEQLRDTFADIDSQFDKIVMQHSSTLKEEYKARLEKQQSEIEKMGGIISTLNDSVRNFKKEIKEKEYEINNLVNLVENMEKEKEEKTAEEKNDNSSGIDEMTPPGPELAEYMNALEKNPSLESILRVRSYFLKTNRYTIGVKTYIDLLDRLNDKKLLPALCVLIGELYLATGKNDEANYYLNNQLVKEDALAMSLLKNLPTNRYV